MAKAVVIAAPSSGSGKTLVTLGLLRAARDAGHKVAAAKLGPDYIDPGFHAAACGAPSVNLDFWSMGGDLCHAVLNNQSKDKDLVIVEGVMGLFDGPEGAMGSTADSAAALSLPIVLVIDCSHQAQSVAALVHGFATFRSDLQIAGLILNKVKSERHSKLLQDALAAGPPILGLLRHNDSVHIPSRHLGLIQAEENQDLEQVIKTIAAGVARETILDKLFQIGAEITNHDVALPNCLAPIGQNIAIARDKAFSFVYPHLLNGWKNQGAALSFFSPLNNEAPDPRADAVYLPGGYPELHAGVLAANGTFLDGLRCHSGLIYGECGGYMVLGHAITDGQGNAHKMAGLLPVETSFATRKLQLGYRQLTTLGGPFAKQLRGHEFHYSTHIETAAAEPLFAASTARDDALPNMGQRVGNVMGSYAHIIAEVLP